MRLPPLPKNLRSRIRSLHRDIGYLIVGLTFVYALSGLAINHIGEWDPNFDEVTTRTTLPMPLPRDELEATAVVRAKLAIDEAPIDHYQTDRELIVHFEGQRVLTVDLDTGEAIDAQRHPRFFLRIANWLHYNRGKRAWTYVADLYALLLLFLALSGLVMLRGRKGFWGRGAALVAIGAAVPIGYVLLSGGP